MPDYLIEIADKARPSLRRKIEQAFALASNAIRMGQDTAERTILSAWADEAVPRIAAAVKDMSQQVIADGGRRTMAQVRTDQAWRFDAVNPRAVAYVSEHTATLVREITEGQREAIRQSIGRVVGGNISAGQAEKHIRSVVGLTAKMEQAAWNARVRAIESGLPAAKVDVVANKYRDSLLKKRAETIARTETIQALSVGREEAWLQAVESGILPPASEKKWIVTYDDRLCPTCRPMAGERVALGETFTGGVSYPPRHPRCRCAITIVRVQTTPLRVTRMERVPVLR